MIIKKTGNIFTNRCDMIVNTVNCQGVMGAGIAKEFKIRYPEMFLDYEEACSRGLVQIGSLKTYDAEPWKILNFPTKKNWRYPSKTKYLEHGLQTFLECHLSMNISSIAFPLLGASKGGISPEVSLNIMEHYLSQCTTLDIEIWEYDSTYPDDLYPKIKALFDEQDDEAIKSSSKLTKSAIHKIRAELSYPGVNSLQSLMRARGLGESSLTHLVQLLKRNESIGSQLSLF